MNKKYIATSIVSVLIPFIVTSCSSPEKGNPDAKPGSEIVLVPLVAIGAIIMGPVLISEEAYNQCADLKKTRVYASSGTKLKDYTDAIAKVEGQMCQYTLSWEDNEVEHFYYRGGKAVYYGRFKNNIAIKYKE